jgi:hypothetical protein
MHHSLGCTATAADRAASWGCSLYWPTALFPHSDFAQARLELEVQRLSGELSASERKLELLASDLAAEQDRAAAQAGLLERKVSS